LKPTFPKWRAVWREYRLKPTAGQAFFRPERPRRARKALKQGGSDVEAAMFGLGGGVFQRSGQTCPAAFVQFGRGSR